MVKVLPKRRGRPLSKGKHEDERRQLAAMIDHALRIGQRGDGTPNEKWVPWTDVAFARKVNQSPAAVAAWRNREIPERPNHIIPVLNVFYGDDPSYADARESMRRAWYRADGKDPDEPPPPRVIATQNLHALANVVTLQLNQPTPDNSGNVILPYTVRFRRELQPKIPVIVDGKPFTDTFDIGLSRPLLAFVSKHWQPLQDTIFRRRKHPNIEHEADDCVRITGPLDKGVVIGDPLDDPSDEQGNGQLDVRMELIDPDKDGSVALAVKVPRDGIKVTQTSGNPVTDIQALVIEAIIAEGCAPDDNGHIPVRTVTTNPRPPKRTE